MTTFWGTVMLLVAAAWLFVLPALWRRPDRGATGPSADRLVLAVLREQLAELDAALAGGRLSAAEHADERAKIERRVVDEITGGPAEPTALVRRVGAADATPSRRAAHGDVLALALLLPGLALGVYAGLGQPGALRTEAGPAPAAASAGHTLTREQMAGMVERLAERLKRNPDDADGWHMLARSYVAFGRYPDAASAYDRAVALSPRDPQVLTDYADTLAMVNGRKLDGRPSELVQAALALDPNHQKALSLAGTAAFNRRDFAAAIAHWQRLQPLLPAQSEAAQRLATSLTQARAALGPGTAPGGAAVPAAASSLAEVVASGPTAAVPGPALAGIAGEVRVAEALRQRVPPGAVLFVFARAVQGSRIPLAVVRSAAGAFPVRFSLDDRNAMSEQHRLSSQTQVMLGARISTGGSAAPQTGDLTGTVGPVPLGSRDAVLLIDGVVP